MKKKNIMVLIFLSAILVIFSMNFGKVKFLFSMLDLHISEFNEEENPVPDNPLDQFAIGNLNENLDNPSNQANTGEPGNTESENPQQPNGQKNKSIEEENKNLVDGTEAIKEDEKIVPSEGKVGASASEEGKSLESIVAEYKPKLEALQSEFFASIDHLISEAANDYNSGTSATQLASKYLSKGTALEKSSDKAVNSVLNNFKNELKSNNHDTKLVEELRSYYESFKKSKKNELLAKAKGYI